MLAALKDAITLSTSQKVVKSIKNQVGSETVTVKILDKKESTAVFSVLSIPNSKYALPVSGVVQKGKVVDLKISPEFELSAVATKQLVNIGDIPAGVYISPAYAEDSKLLFYIDNSLVYVRTKAVKDTTTNGYNCEITIKHSKAGYNTISIEPLNKLTESEVENFSRDLTNFLE